MIYEIWGFGTVIKNQKYKNGFKIKIEKTTGGCVQAHVIL